MKNVFGMFVFVFFSMAALAVPDPASYCKKAENDGKKFNGPCQPYADEKDNDEGTLFMMSRYECKDLKAVEIEKDIDCK